MFAGNETTKLYHNKALASSVLVRVKAAQNELGQQILADFEEAFPSQGTKVKFSLPLFLPLKIVAANYSM